MRWPARSPGRPGPSPGPGRMRPGRGTRPSRPAWMTPGLSRSVLAPTVTRLPGGPPGDNPRARHAAAGTLGEGERGRRLHGAAPEPTAEGVAGGGRLRGGDRADGSPALRGHPAAGAGIHRRYMAEPTAEHEVLPVCGLEGALQFGDLLALAALELGELAGERGDDAAGLIRADGGFPGGPGRSCCQARRCSTRCRMAGFAVEEVQRHRGGCGQAAKVTGWPVSIPVAVSHRCRDVERAIAVAGEGGGPVPLKADLAAPAHASGIGAVLVGLEADRRCGPAGASSNAGYWPLAGNGPGRSCSRWCRPPPTTWWARSTTRSGRVARQRSARPGGTARAQPALHPAARTGPRGRRGQTLNPVRCMTSGCLGLDIRL